MGIEKKMVTIFLLFMDIYKITPDFCGFFFNFDDRVLGTPHRFLGTTRRWIACVIQYMTVFFHINHLSIPKQGIEKGDLAY